MVTHRKVVIFSDSLFISTYIKNGFLAWILGLGIAGFLPDRLICFG